jgi:hypothetical protein
MTNDIIETIVFLIPGFICFEIFLLFSGIDIKLHDKKYYLICLSISSLIYIVPALFSGMLYIQELNSSLTKISTLLFTYGVSIFISIIAAIEVKNKLYPNHPIVLHEPWVDFLVNISTDGASYVTVFTSDDSEIVGKLKMFTHKKNESKEIIIEDPYQIIRDENKNPIAKMDIGKSVLFTEKDICRIISHEIPKNEHNWLEKILKIRI